MKSSYEWLGDYLVDYLLLIPSPSFMSYELNEESNYEVHFDLCAKPLAAIYPATLKSGTYMWNENLKKKYYLQGTTLEIEIQ